LKRPTVSREDPGEDVLFVAALWDTDGP